MKIGTIIIVLFCSIFSNQIFGNRCELREKYTRKEFPKTLFVFFVAFKTLEQDNQQISFVMQQIACSIPQNSIFSYALSEKDYQFQTYSNLVYLKEALKWSSDKHNTESTCDVYNKYLKNLKNSTSRQDFDRIEIIMYFPKFSDCEGNILEFKKLNFRAQLNLVGSGYIGTPGFKFLNFSEFSKINYTLEATNELKDATTFFVNDILEIPPDKPSIFDLEIFLSAITGFLFSILVAVLIFLMIWSNFLREKKQKAPTPDAKPILSNIKTIYFQDDDLGTEVTVTIPNETKKESENKKDAGKEKEAKKSTKTLVSEKVKTSANFDDTYAVPDKKSAPKTPSKKESSGNFDDTYAAAPSKTTPKKSPAKKTRDSDESTSKTLATTQTNTNVHDDDLGEISGKKK